MSKALALVLLAGCAQFKPPANGGGGGGEAEASSGACAAPGFPYSYADEKGTTVVDDGLHLKGKLADGADVFAGVGLVFNEPKTPLDGSRYQGIVFKARRAAGSAAHVRLKVPDVNTDPAGGVCKECYNDFGIQFQVGEEWTRYEVKFADLAQEADWGDPRPPALDTKQLYGVQWQVATAGAELDLEIDDVSFLGCGDD